MVDTLAPKKIFTQRELDTKLTPIGEQVLRSRARPKLLDTTPVFGTETSLLDRQAKSEQDKAQAMMSPVEEQEQNVQSSQETLDTKQTGERVKEDTPQGLVMKPISYAAKGIDDKEISGPIIVGEIGPEMIVPTGDGKISILPTKIVAGIMDKPTKKAQMGMKDVTIGSANMMPPTGPLPALKAADSESLGMMPPSMPPGMKSNNQSEAINNTPIFAGTDLEKQFTLPSIVSKGLGVNSDNPGYQFGKVQSAVNEKFNTEIEPKLKDLNVPKNIAGTDISSSLRDSYAHSYASGIFNLIGGEAASNFVAQKTQEYYQIFYPMSGISRKQDSPDEREEVLMDINNNRVGFNIANEVRQELEIKDNEKISGEKLVEAETLFAKKHSEMYMDEVKRHSEGDQNKLEYDDVEDTKKYKSILNKIMKDENPRRLALKFGPQKIDSVKEEKASAREAFRST